MGEMKSPDRRRLQLGEGWSIELPPSFASRTNPDGSWSAWDAERVIDVQLLSTEGRDGKPIDAAAMLGGFESGTHEWERRDSGVLGVADLVEEQDETGPILRLRSETAVPNQLLSCWFGFRHREDTDWALAVWNTIKNDG
jgi:hypothetical protein